MLSGGSLGDPSPANIIAISWMGMCVHGEVILQDVLVEAMLIPSFRNLLAKLLRGSRGVEKLQNVAYFGTFVTRLRLTELHCILDQTCWFRQHKVRLCHSQEMLCEIVCDQLK